jgi:ferredoxin/flavodoxin
VTLFVLTTSCDLQADKRVPRLKNRGKLSRALVLWYSQTGHTERNARLIASTLEKLGLNVTASEVRGFDKASVVNFDLIVIGTPVFYYDIPEYVRNWIKSLPSIEGIAVASFVTFGGPEGDQHNAACTILELLSDHGGVPVSVQTFMNMGTMPTVWSDEHVSEKVWNNRHLPNEETYQNVRRYASLLIEQVKQGNHFKVAKKLTIRRLSTTFDLIWWTKLLINKHTIDKKKCIECGTCRSKCPSDAIDPLSGHVNSERCVLCFGCINNCPTQAIDMEYRGRKLFGFLELLKRKGITIKEPEELRHGDIRHLTLNVPF